MRVAAYNVENLFSRARALDPAQRQRNKPILEAYARLTKLFEEPVYAPQTKDEMVSLLRLLKIDRSDDGPFVRLRRNKGSLLRRPKGKPVEVIAKGRSSWIGWLELETEAVDAEATRNLGRVIRDRHPDVLAVVEAEDRIALKRFNDDVLPLPQVGGQPYEHVMVIDGNDERGIDVGLMSRAPYDILHMRSHVDDQDTAGLIFSRDCPEYELTTPSGERLLLLVNHLKSKGFGNQLDNDGRRLRQAQRIRDVYDARRAEGMDNIVILGDLNDTPDRDPLEPLLGLGSDLRDISQLPQFETDGRDGTYANGTKGTKIDYVLLSPALQAKVDAAGVFRQGVWGGKNGTLWPIYDTIKSKEQAASDHAMLWVDLQL